MSKQLVLVTGATGHLGFRTLVFTLQHGFKTRVALRKLEQEKTLKATKSLQPFLHDVEFIQVPDITAHGAYDEAIKGVDFVLHVASPIYSGLDPEDRDWKKLMYDPAEKGALSMLTAAAKEKGVKRVVVTSSVVVVEAKNGSDRAGPYDLKDVPSAEALQEAPVAPMAYALSKVLAHHRSTEFVEKHKVSFDLVRVLPGYIQGANELYTSAEAMRDMAILGSNEGTVRTALGTNSHEPRRITMQVFLDDVAKAHVVALEAEKVKNRDNLLIIGNGGDSEHWKDVASIIKRQFPEAVKKGILRPELVEEDAVPKADVRSSEEKLGFKFAGSEEYVKSVVGQYLEFVGA